MLNPLLLLDIDGVISLFGFDVATPPAGDLRSVDGIPHLLSAGSGTRIRRLTTGFDVVWCSGWEEKANEVLPWALGLDGPFPFLHFERTVGRANTHWKLDAIDAYAGPERSLAWVDDAFDERCSAWAAARPGPTRLEPTESAIGLTVAHVDALLAWAHSAGRPPGGGSPACAG